MKLVMFSQNFCAPCRQLKPHLDAAAQQLGIEVEVWDVEDNWALCKEYGVEYTPTVFFMDDDGFEVRLVSTDPKQTRPNALAIMNEVEQYADNV